MDSPILIATVIECFQSSRLSGGSTAGLRDAGGRSAFGCRRRGVATPTPPHNHPPACTHANTAYLTPGHCALWRPPASPGARQCCCCCGGGGRRLRPLRVVAAGRRRQGRRWRARRAMREACRLRLVAGSRCQPSAIRLVSCRAAGRWASIGAAGLIVGGCVVFS